MRTAFDFFANAALGAILPTAFILGGLIAYYVIAASRGRLCDNWPLPHSMGLLALFVVLLGIPVGLVLQGSIFQTILELAGAVWFILPGLVIFGIAALVFRVRGQRVPAPLKQWALLFAACLPAFALSYGAGKAIDQWQISAARAYVERAAPVLDGIKASTGSYPTALPVPTLGQPPVLLRPDDAYTSDGKEFQFQYSDPAAFLGEGSQFESTTRTWSYYDPMG